LTNARKRGGNQGPVSRPPPNAGGAGMGGGTAGRNTLKKFLNTGANVMSLKGDQRGSRVSKEDRKSIER